MSRATVIRHQNLTARVQREHLPQSRFSGKRDDAVRTNLVCKLVVGPSFGRRTSKPNKQLRVTLEQPARKFDITQRRPPPQRQQVARVRVEQDEWRRTDTRIFAL